MLGVLRSPWRSLEVMGGSWEFLGGPGIDLGSDVSIRNVLGGPGVSCEVLGGPGEVLAGSGRSWEVL